MIIPLRLALGRDGKPGGLGELRSEVSKSIYEFDHVVHLEIWSRND